MPESPKLSVAIVGAGIAGLATAIALQKDHGIDVQVYERSEQLQEIGASIALGPNGLKSLDRLGVQNALEDSVAFRNKSGWPMIYRHYQTDETISVDTHAGAIPYRYRTSRFFRPHLHRALLQHVDSSTVHLGKSFLSLEFDRVADKLVINFTDGTSAAADVLLGSDGIHSAVRNYFVPTAKARWTGWVAFRSVFPRSCLDHIPNLPDEAVHIWGPDRMLFMSPLAQDLFTIVGSYQSNPNAPDAPYKDSIWNSEGDVNELREYYKNWSPMVRSVIDSTPYIRIYPNAAANGLETWILGDSRVTLAGDAAHAHGGAFAAGGSLAIDDAWAFSESILHTFSNAEYDHVSKRDKISAALRIYEAVRKAHTDKVQNIVQVRNKKLLDRLGTIETDESLRKRMANREDLSWIHEHDVEQVFRQVLADEESTTHTAHL